MSQNVETVLTVKIDGLAHDALRELILHWFNETGVRIESVEIVWDAVQTIGLPAEWKPVNIRMTGSSGDI